MTVAPATSLFRQLLPAQFDALPPSVRRLHERDGLARYPGKVEVDGGRHPLARLCAWATRLPREGRGPLRVEIEAAAGGERWARIIAGRAMRSRLWSHDGLLRERLGLVTFDFRLRVDTLPGAGAALVWQVASARVFGVRLPVGWFGAVGAREYERDGRYRFDVTAALPGIGRLVHYRGWLDVG